MLFAAVQKSERQIEARPDGRSGTRSHRWPLAI